MVSFGTLFLEDGSVLGGNALFVRLLSWERFSYKTPYMERLFRKTHKLIESNQSVHSIKASPVRRGVCRTAIRVMKGTRSVSE
jgi:hypothetical protein